MKIENFDSKIKKSKNSVRPFVYNIPSISAVSWRIIMLLMIQILLLVVTKSFSALLVIFASTLGAFAAVGLNHVFNREYLYNIPNIIIPGIFIGMLLPETYPPLIAFIITAFTVFISRSIVFKGVNCWLNIAPIAIIIAWHIGKDYFPGFQLNSGIVNLRNSSVFLIENGTFPTYSFDSPITAFLNKYIFRLFNVSVPEGFISLIWDSHSIIPAFRFNFAIVISAIIIFSDNAFSMIIPSLFLFVYCLMVRLFGTYLMGGEFNQGDIILALFSSGMLFCATFLIQWYGTIPVTVGGKIILGTLSGIIAFSIVGAGTSPVGMVYTVLLSNIICMIIRIFEEKNNEIATGRIIEKLYARMEGKTK